MSAAGNGWILRGRVLEAKNSKDSAETLSFEAGLRATLSRVDEDAAPPTRGGKDLRSVCRREVIECLSD
jgi:hypothetical protein